MAAFPFQVATFVWWGLQYINGDGCSNPNTVAALCDIEFGTQARLLAQSTQLAHNDIARIGAVHQRVFDMNNVNGEAFEWIRQLLRRLRVRWHLYLSIRSIGGRGIGVTRRHDSTRRHRCRARQERARGWIGLELHRTSTNMCWLLMVRSRTTLAARVTRLMRAFPPRRRARSIATADVARGIGQCLRRGHAVEMGGRHFWRRSQIAVQSSLAFPSQLGRCGWLFHAHGRVVGGFQWWTLNDLARLGTGLSPFVDDAVGEKPQFGNQMPRAEVAVQVFIAHTVVVRTLNEDGPKGSIGNLGRCVFPDDVVARSHAYRVGLDVAKYQHLVARCIIADEECRARDRLEHVVPFHVRRRRLPSLDTWSHGTRRH